MKSTIRLVIYLILFLSYWTKAQTVLSLTVSPALPNVSHTISLIAQDQFPYSGCPRTSWLVNNMGSTILAHAWHSMGMLTAICNHNDTLVLGQLAAGTYTLIYYTYDANNGANWDSDTIQFTVAGLVGIKNTNSKFDDPSVYPNPSASGQFVLRQEFQELQLSYTVYNALGTRIEMSTGLDGTIDLSDQPDGLYVLEVNGFSKAWRTRLLKYSD